MVMTNLVGVLNDVDGDSGVDIDDTFIPVRRPLMEYTNKVFGHRLPRPFTEHDFVIYGLERIKLLHDAGITREDISTMLQVMESEGALENIMPDNYAVRSLKRLSTRKGKVYFVTSRANGFYKDARGMTDRWLTKLAMQHEFTPADTIYNHNKEETLKKLNIARFFEDNPYFAISLLEKGVPVVLFNLPINHMNSHDRDVISEKAYKEKVDLIKRLDSYKGKLLFRVNNWEDVYKHLM